LPQSLILGALSVRLVTLSIDRKCHKAWVKREKCHRGLHFPKKRHHGHLPLKKHHRGANPIRKHHRGAIRSKSITLGALGARPGCKKHQSDEDAIISKSDEEPHQTDSPSPTSDYTWCVFNGDTWSEGYWEPRTFTSEELKSWVVADRSVLTRFCCRVLEQPVFTAEHEVDESACWYSGSSWYSDVKEVQGWLGRFQRCFRQMEYLFGTSGGSYARRSLRLRT
jgi:hypothetical protein